MLQHGRHEKYSSTVQFIFCTCSPRRQPRDNTGQVIFSFENCSPLLRSLQSQQKSVGFLPSTCVRTEGAPTELRHLVIRWMPKGLFTMLFPFLQRYVLLSSIYMSSTVLTPPHNFFYGDQTNVYLGGSLLCLSAWLLLHYDCFQLSLSITQLLLSTSVLAASIRGKEGKREGDGLSAELGRNVILV